MLKYISSHPKIMMRFYSTMKNKMILKTRKFMFLNCDYININESFIIQQNGAKTKLILLYLEKYKLQAFKYMYYHLK